MMKILSSYLRCARVLTTLVGLAFAVTSYPETRAEGPIKLDEFANLSEMNGISYKDYAHFSKEWELVTVRYREDTQELRFTYANRTAQKIISKVVSSEAVEYPKGAVFAKVSYFTARDPLFASSRVPSVSKRIQFMVRDPSRYSGTQGWGYALFNSEGKTLNGEPKAMANACAACHQMVKNRGYVFSQPIGVFARGAFGGASGQHGGIDSNPIRFEEVARTQLPQTMARNITVPGKRIFLLRGALEEKLFEGTLNEVLPTLIEKARAVQAPAGLVSSDGRLFSVAYLDSNLKDCGKSQQGIRTVRTIFDHSDPQTTILKLGQSCIERHSTPQ